MASETEPAKLLLPYLQRADELQKHDPLVAYYCRLYAMERGLKIPQGERTKTTNSLLISLMNQLEKDKKSLKLGPEDNLHLEGFALNVFSKADKQDQAGRADLNTAKTFYAASIFFEILNQFGPVQPDLEQKQKYAVWKAADIRKAIKEGRKPVAGPPGGGDDLSVPSATPTGSMDLGKSETTVTSPRSDSGQSSHFQDELPPAPTNTIRASHFQNNIDNRHSPDIPSSPPSHDFQPAPPSIDRSDSSNYSNPSASYPSHDYFPPPSHRPDNSSYSQPYHHQAFPQEPPPPPPPQHLPHNYPTHETSSSSFNYPNFQSYPSFTETSLPSVPAQYPTYYQGSETSFSHQVPPAASFTSTSQYTSSSSRNGTVTEPAAAPKSPAQNYQYDSSYEPPPEKIAEAHKAARFAVGALAFDDVSVAVDFLKKSLELLTNPSATGH